MKRTGNSGVKGGVLLILSACAVVTLGLGIAYGQWPEASEDALNLVFKTQRLIKARSHNPQVQDLLSDVGMDFEGKNYGNAVKSFQRARRHGLLDSGFSDEEMNALKAVEVRALTLLAMQYRESREYDLAKYALRRAREIDKNDKFLNNIEELMFSYKWSSEKPDSHPAPQEGIKQYEPRRSSEKSDSHPAPPDPSIGRFLKARFGFKDALELEEQKKYLDASHEITIAYNSFPNNEKIIQAYERIIQQAILSEPEAGAWVRIFIAGVRVDFCWCPPTGNEGFKMGSPTDEKYRNDDETQHKVVITQGFWLATEETTQELWQAVMGENPSHFKGDYRPVEQISWNDCQEFIKKIQQYAPEGTKFKLPSEAHWEYACRAGTTTMYSQGDQYLGGHYKPETWDSGERNSWGLINMHGNVWEWCEDWYGNYSHEILENPTGPKTGSLRVIRGGSWREDKKDWRSARRGTALPNTRSSSIGFRLELSVDNSN